MSSDERITLVSEIFAKVGNKGKVSTGNLLVFAHMTDDEIKETHKALFKKENKG